MLYPFLLNNELVLFDFLPGSSGQLLMRIWSEVDKKLKYNNNKILTDIAINSHPSTREVAYDIIIPKRITNWFLDKCGPEAILDYATFFEFLATHLLAGRQRWNWGDDEIKFYENSQYEMKNNRVLYGIHTWEKQVPFHALRAAGFNVRCISIVPRTAQGLKYQSTRCRICYPINKPYWDKMLRIFNSKPNIEEFDFCTLLADKKTTEILAWLQSMLGKDFDATKASRVEDILAKYYLEIVDQLYV